MTPVDETGVPAEEVRQIVRRRLRYGLSLPERVVRSTAGVLGGALRESATVLLPQAFRDAQTYRGFVGQMLDFMAEDMGGVERAGQRHEGDRVERYVARKTVGNFVELASLATVHLSPMLVLALVSDIAYGSRAYLAEFAQELEQRGVIEDADAIRKADDLLDAVADASQRTATAFDTPPLSVDGLRETIRETRESLAEVDVASVLPEVELRGLWERISAAAQRQGVSPFAVSGLMTLGALDREGAREPSAGEPQERASAGEREGVPLARESPQPGSARGHPSQERALSRGARGGTPRKREPSAGEREGVPLA